MATTTEPREKQIQEEKTPWLSGSPAQLIQGLLFGLLFGFLLQKGGVAKFDILIGILLLENFVVVKVMLSAIIVGMVGIYILNRQGLAELQIKDAILGANILGGLIFGVGFALIAYCPGTNAAATGQGNLDALVGILGMLVGSYLFALSSKFSSGTISKKGNLGKKTLPQLVGLSPGIFIAIAVPLLIAVLVLLELYAG
jgi:uncharacterized protein